MMKNINIHNVKPKAQRTLLFTGTMLNINYIARTSTAGKEFDMVTRYIDFWLRSMKSSKKESCNFHRASIRHRVSRYRSR